MKNVLTQLMVMVFLSTCSAPYIYDRNVCHSGAAYPPVEYKMSGCVNGKTREVNDADFEKHQKDLHEHLQETKD